jgi:iron complex outermembrane receptor protein
MRFALGYRRNVARRVAAGAAACALCAVCAVLRPDAAHAQGEPAADPVAVDPVVVTAGRLPLPAASAGRVEVITREQIAQLPDHSVEELLSGIAGVDVRRRGPGGVQADVSIRGASFEETLVLLDGVPLTDPQTGHHAFDLPVTVAEIERIEVLKGAGSRAFGPNAFGGVINIVTRRPAGRALALEARAGSDGLRAGSASASVDAGGFAARLAASGSRGDGSRYNSDFELGTVSLAAAVPAGPASLALNAGATDKDFGANGFYSDRYPNQRERTKVAFASLGTEVGTGAVRVAPRVFWRRHEDRYVLDFERPAFYENRHETEVGGAEVRTTLESAAGLTVLGGDLAQENIDSSSLGDHGRTRAGLFVNHRVGLGERASLAAGAFAAYHTDWGWKLWPGADFGVDLGRGARLFLTADKSYRVPTYTELYYRSPASVGNPDLAPEQAWSYEIGAEWRGRGRRAGLSFFRRDGTDLIDWVRADPALPWQALNRTEVRTVGLEAGYEWRSAAAAAVLRRLRAGYVWLDSSRAAAGVESKYVLDHLRHQAVLEAEHALGARFAETWRFAWEQRLGGDAYFLAETRIRRPIAHGELYLEATNLFNASYAEIGGIPGTGRQVAAGLKLDFGPW